MNRCLVLFSIILVVITLTVAPTTNGASLLPVGIPEFDFVYTQIDRQAVGSSNLFDYQLGPYWNKNLFNAGLHSPGSGFARLESYSLNLFSIIAEDYRTVRNQPSLQFESFRAGIAASPIEKMFVYGNFVLDESRAKNPDYTGHTWNGLAGGVEQALVALRLGSFDLNAGRFASFWGPRNSLLLSSKSAMDGFAYRFRWGRLSFSYQLSKLDHLPNESDPSGPMIERYFAAHRLDLHLANHIRLGLFEAVIYGGPGRQIELVYLNPLMLYHAAQINSDVDDNSLLGFDFDFQPVHNLSLYGQLLVDDFQLDNKTQSDQEPDQFGIMLGGYAVNLMGRFDLRADFERVTNWTFNQPLARNRYLFKGEPIGGARGNDYDLWQINLDHWFGGEIMTSLSLSQLRQGEGNPATDWSAPWLATGGEYSESFPTGVVETTTTFAGRLRAFIFGHAFVDLHGGAHQIDNFEHQQDDNRSLPFLNLRLSTFFSTNVDIK